MNVPVNAPLNDPASAMLPYQLALDRTAATLAAAGIEGARGEARRLLAHLLRLPARQLPPSGAALPAAPLAALAARRAAHEPLAYITGTQGFWTFEVAVSRETLIPRPDSETLIETALQALPERAAVRRVLDLGTGTGCLLLAALLEFPDAFGVGVDLRAGAASLAARNAASLGLAPRAAFLAGNWADALAAHFDLVLCNPPYIASGEMPGLMPDVLLYEPASALQAGPDGLDCYARLLPALGGLLAPGGIGILEIGRGQAEPVCALATASGLRVLCLSEDLGGIERALALQAA